MTFVSFSEVDAALAERKPVYIANKARHHLSGAQSIVVINFMTVEGSRSFNVPRTSIPFNICDYVDPDSLRTSQSFRKLLNNGTLQVVAEAEAQIARNDPAAMQSFRAAYNEANNTYVARSAENRKNNEAHAADRAERQKNTSAGMKNIIAAMDPKLAEALNIMNADGQRPDPVLETKRNPRIVALEARVKSGTLQGQAVVDELSLMFGDLTIEDLHGISGGGFWPVEAQNWARERVAHKMKAQNEAAALASAAPGGTLPPGGASGLTDVE